MICFSAEEAADRDQQPTSVLVAPEKTLVYLRCMAREGATPCPWPTVTECCTEAVVVCLLMNLSFDSQLISRLGTP